VYQFDTTPNKVYDSHTADYTVCPMKSVIRVQFIVHWITLYAPHVFIQWRLPMNGKTTLNSQYPKHRKQHCETYLPQGGTYADP
jgi:hypothetical protein